MAKIEAIKTPVDINELYSALQKAWTKKFVSEPKKASLLVLMAQWALETGWGKNMYCYNLGNVKATDKYKIDWCYFACSEILPKSKVFMYTRNDRRAKWVRDVSGYDAEVRFSPDHPCCKFRAYKTLDEGVESFLDILYDKFYAAWNYIIKGDPAMYGSALKKLHYYTAKEDLYVKALVGVFNMLKKKIVVPSYAESISDEVSNLATMHLIANVSKRKAWLKSRTNGCLASSDSGIIKEVSDGKGK